MASTQSDPASKEDVVVAEPLAMSDTVQTSHTTSTIEVDEHGHLTVWQAIKKWNRVFWYTLSISSTILMFGYDFVIVGNSSAMPAFQYVPLYNEYTLTSSGCRLSHQTYRG